MGKMIKFSLCTYNIQSYVGPCRLTPLVHFVFKDTKFGIIGRPFGLENNYVVGFLDLVVFKGIKLNLRGFLPSRLMEKLEVSSEIVKLLEGHDICCIQEIDGPRQQEYETSFSGHSDALSIGSGFVNQPAKIAGQTGKDGRYAFADRVYLIHVGNATYWSDKTKGGDNIQHVSSQKVFFEYFKTTQLDARDVLKQQRIMLETVLNIGGHEVYMLNTHLSLKNQDRREEIQQIANHVQSLIRNGRNVVLAGDFNTSSPPRGALTRNSSRTERTNQDSETKSQRAYAILEPLAEAGLRPCYQDIPELKVEEIASYPAQWGKPQPTAAMDQIWCSQGIQTLSYGVKREMSLNSGRIAAFARSSLAKRIGRKFDRIESIRDRLVKRFINYSDHYPVQAELLIRDKT
jgi:endonuclease/exonuclease/phosphatase family metal-dependent hydrolase